MDTAIAEMALADYDLPHAQITFLGQSQNTTFRVETQAGERFLLRLHVGIEAAGELHLWRQPNVIESELLWLNALAQETTLHVPQPVQNRWGAWVTNLTTQELESPISCSLLRWVKGEHLADKPTVQQIRQLGQRVAQLHQQSSRWTLPAGFFRPTHGINQLKAAVLQLAALVEPGIISRADYQVFQETAAQVQQLMSGLPQTRNTWGLIHADLHQGNYVLNDETVCPIDFSRCGFGFYLYDIAESLGDIDAALRPHFFEGYTRIRKLPTDYQRLVEAFFNGATVENFAFLSTNSQEHDWLARTVPYVVENHLQPYLRGEDFLFLT